MSSHRQRVIRADGRTLNIVQPAVICPTVSRDAAVGVLNAATPRFQSMSIRKSGLDEKFVARFI